MESTVVTRHLVCRALARLSVEHREVAVLYYLQELTVAEIASVLGVPVGTVKSRLHYARRRRHPRRVKRRNGLLVRAKPDPLIGWCALLIDRRTGLPWR